MRRLKPQRHWLSLAVALLLAAPTLQSVYNFRLPYCSEIQSDTQVVQNPLRIYLLIFRSLFCLTGNREDAIKASSQFLAADQAKAKADKLFEAEKSAKSCPASTTAQTVDNVMLQLTGEAGLIRLPTNSMSLVTTDKLNVDVGFL